MNRQRAKVTLSVAGAVFFLIACGEEPTEVNEINWFAFEDPLSFDAVDQDLVDRFHVDPEGRGWILEAIEAEDETFDRIGFMIDAVSEPILEVRVSPNGRKTWSDWYAAPVVWNEGELYTAHVDIPHGGTHVEVRLLSPKPEDLSFLLVEGFVYSPEWLLDGADESDYEIGEIEPESSVFGTHAQALASNRGVDVTRAGWSARNRVSRGGCLVRHTINRVTVHHTVTPNNDRHSMAVRLRGMQTYHIDSRGYCDIGYHFLVGQDGKVYQGRVETNRGRHTGGNNTHNGGVSFIGTYTTAVPSTSMLRGGAKILSAIHCHYGVSLDRSKIKGHREYGSTECPGTALYNRLSSMITSAASVNCSGVPNPPTDPPPTTTTPPPTTTVPPPSDPPTNPPANGILMQGIVYEHGDQSARISGATVRAGGQSATTNHNGYYTIRVSPGTHTFTFNASGYEQGSLQRTVNTRNNQWASAGLRKSTAPVGQGRIVGVVYESPSSTNRISGATVNLSNGQSASTRADGYFAFDVPPGQYTVSASYSGYKPGTRAVTVSNGATVWGSIGLQKEEQLGVVEGIIYENPSSSRRIQGGTVTLSNGDRVTTNTAGHFFFRASPGTYRITASKAEYASRTVVATITAGGDDWIQIGLDRAASGTGELIGVIYERPDSDVRIPGASVWTSTGQTAQADSNGIYRMSDVPAGEVSVYASADGYNSGSVDRTVQAGEQIWASIGLSKEDSDSEDGIRVIAPINGEVTGSDPEFEWENITFEQTVTESFKYRVVVVNMEGTESFEGEVEGVMEGITKTTVGLSLEAGLWRWAVYAITDGGNLIASSAMNEFEVR